MKHYSINLNGWLCFVLVGVFACQNQAATETNNKNNSFEIVMPLVKDTTYSQEYVAELVAIQNVEIRTKIKGYLRKIYVDEGQFVKSGTLLFGIDNEELKQELLKAQAYLRSVEAEARTAELEVANTRILVEKNVVSKAELELAQAKWDISKAKIEEAKAQVNSTHLQISFTEIKAPFDGFMNLIPYKIGSLVDEGTLLSTLSDNSQIFAYFNLSEREYLDLRINVLEKQPFVALRLVNDSLYSIRGKIETMAGEFDSQTGNIAVRVRFDNPQKLLKHGESGKIILENPLGKVLLVPQKSVFEIQHQSYVYVLEKDNRLKRRRIDLGVRVADFFVVKQGLNSQDKVLYEGIQLVREGEQIVPRLVSF